MAPGGGPRAQPPCSGGSPEARLVLSFPHSKRDVEAVTGARRVLLASYHFPPDAAVGALRVAKFARFLPEFGCDVHALTVQDRYREEGLDEGRLKGLEDVPVVRTRELPRLETLIARIRRRAGRR